MKEVFNSTDQYSVTAYSGESKKLILGNSDNTHQIVFEGTEGMILSSVIKSLKITQINMAEKFCYPQSLNVEYDKSKSLYRIEAENCTAFVVVTNMLVN